MKAIEFKILTKGLGIAIIFSFVFTLILSIFYYLTSLQESLFLSLMCTGGGILIGSAVAARKALSRGIFYGLTIGLTFFLVTLLVHFLLNPSPPTIASLLPKFVIYFLSGVLGSVFGVLTKK